MRFRPCFFYAWPHEVFGLLVKDAMALVKAFFISVCYACFRYAFIRGRNVESVEERK